MLRSPATSWACRSPFSSPSVTKWKVVPPFVAIAACGLCVSTKIGIWNGGSSPQPPATS